MHIFASIVLFIIICVVWAIGATAALTCDDRSIENAIMREDPLAAYLSEYNPLVDYYASVPMTMSDVAFVDKMLHPCIILPHLHMSRLMLLKIYFKRADIKQRLTESEYARVLSQASAAYEQYTAHVMDHPDRVFVPDMFGYRDIVKKDASTYAADVRAMNERFYFDVAS